MSDFRAAILISLFAASTTCALAEEFPEAPIKLKDAEAQGLQRVNNVGGWPAHAIH